MTTISITICIPKSDYQLSMKAFKLFTRIEITQEHFSTVHYIATINGIVKDLMNLQNEIGKLYIHSECQ